MPAAVSSDSHAAILDRGHSKQRGRSRQSHDPRQGPLKKWHSNAHRAQARAHLKQQMRTARRRERTRSSKCAPRAGESARTQRNAHRAQARAHPKKQMRTARRRERVGAASAQSGRVGAARAHVEKRRAHAAWPQRGRSVGAAWGQPRAQLHGLPVEHSVWDSLTPLLEPSSETLLPQQRTLIALF